MCWCFNHSKNIGSTTISDKKIPIDNNGLIDYYVADITSVCDSAKCYFETYPYKVQNLHWLIPNLKSLEFVENELLRIHNRYYYPFGSPMDGRTFGSERYRFGFNGQEKDDEVAGTGNTNTAMFWEYDTRLGRRWNVDPMAHEREWLSPYNYCSLNPINRTDPTGALDGEYELDDNNNWQKVSTKGDDIGVDFYHTDGVDNKGNATQTTFVTDRQGNWNTINNGRYALQGETRSNDVNWKTIYNEWSEGYGPERSVFEGNHPANLDIKNNYLYKNAAEDFQETGDSKGGGEVNFWYLWDNVGTGTNMQVQMMGSYNASFYKLGDKTFSLIQDSKSRSSFYYHLPVQNYKRGTRTYNIPGTWIYNDKEANTYQTYIFFK